MALQGAQHPNWRKTRKFPANRPEVAFIDFDGTLSLVRADWMPIMREQMYQALRPLCSHDSDSELKAKIEQWIQENNGKPTWHQMERLHKEILHRNGNSPGWQLHLEYFSNLLKAKVDPIKEQLRCRQIDPETRCVPGAHELLENLQKKGLELHLVSGTALEHVLEEADLLDLSSFFGDRIHAPNPGTTDFSKASVLESIAPDPIDRCKVLAIGDGPVEISLVSQNGGLAVGVARSDNHAGIDPFIGNLLEKCGAQALIPDFTQAEQFTDWLLSCQDE